MTKTEEKKMGKKTFLCIDSGQFIEQCNALAMGGKNKVYYFTDSERAFPVLQDAAPGMDFEYLESVPHLFDFLNDHRDEIDCIVNWDSCNQDLIADMRDDPRNKGKSIFGSGLGARIEEDREGFKKILKRLGLDVGKKDGTGEGDYVIKYGVQEVEEYLKKHPDIYAKIDKFRGNFETTHLISYKDEMLDGTFTHFRKELGPPFERRQKFILEHAINDAIEIGMDGFINAKGLASKHTWGVEYKKGPYLCTNQELPKPLQETMDKLVPFLKALDYRGCFSTEERVKKEKHYLIDPTPRGALPLTVGYSKWITNLDEVVYKIGLNEDVEVKMPYKYMLAVPMYSSKGKDEYVRLKVEKKHRENIKFRGCCSDGDGNYYICKGMEGAVVIVLGGDNWKDLLKQAKEEVNYVEFDEKQDFETSIVDDFPKLISEIEDMGIKF